MLRRTIASTGVWSTLKRTDFVQGAFFASQGFSSPLKPTETHGFPIRVSPVGSFPFTPEINREDVFRFFAMCDIAREDIIVQYTATFRPICWWIRFHTQEDREKALKIPGARWGGMKMYMEEKNMREWQIGTYNHLVGKSLGTALVINRLAFDTTPDDLASFFRNFHLQGNGITLLQDPYRQNIDEQDQFKRAIVRLISKQEAQRAARALHRKYLRNNMVNVKVLQ